MRDALSMFDKAVAFCGAKLNYRDVAASLNVLDYDTYFRFTDLLLGGDYVNALLEFDAVLTKGFSGQVFMGGLNQHMRDLLVAKGPAINLIEFTGDLLEHYRRQAANCDTAFLFGAISLLSEADGKLRTASNQRLLVELTLMKIAALSQKKNSELTLPTEESYPLPTLDEPQRVVVQPVAQPVAQPAVQAAPAISKPEPQSVAQPQTTVQLAAQPQRVVGGGAARRGSNISSALASGSITNLMKSVSGGAQTEESEDFYTDPQSESKLRSSMERFIEAIVTKHPRFSPAFESVKVSGNTIITEVSSAIMRDDLYNSRGEITDIIADISGVNGVIKLDIVLNETEVKLRPIKLEDRLAHISSKTPLFDEMVEGLELELD
jgi:DNA polymerase-3 subunit gamma/tau